MGRMVNYLDERRKIQERWDKSGIFKDLGESVNASFQNVIAKSLDKANREPISKDIPDTSKSGKIIINITDLEF